MLHENIVENLSEELENAGLIKIINKTKRNK